MLLQLTQLFAVLGFLVAVVGLALRWRDAQRRPPPMDRSPAKGSPQRGVFYAFTLGMAPWAKESTRRHVLAYLRGVGFHVGLFAGLAALLVSPWWSFIPSPILFFFSLITGLGALFGLVGEIMRWSERNLRALSTADDHASVVLVTLFLALTTMALINAAWLPVMYAASAVMLAYVPLGKIRHCLYFFFSRRFFGLFIGRRAVVHVEVRR